VPPNALTKDETPPLKLNLGCGGLLMDGFAGVDLVALPGVDVVHDLNVLPWPFKDATADEIVALDIFEHVDDALDFMGECGRILQAGGVLRLRTPHWQSPNAFCDPTHKRFPTEKTWDYFCPDTEFGQKYGAAYARGVAFRKLLVQLRGQELVVALERL
jgi:SAM-dependent methyltransferase